MSVQNDILEVLSQRDQPVKTSELAEALKKPTSTIRGETTRLKQKEYIEGDSQEGWVITDIAKERLEKGELHPSMIDEGVTPRQQFEAIGQRIGIPENKIIVTSDIVWSGDYDDIQWVWEALHQANIADDLRRVWANSWRAKLHKGIPPELETELTGVGKTEAEAEKGVASSKRGREYIIVDDEPVRVGENLGDYSLQDAKDILGLRALKARFSGAGQAGTGQGGVTGSEDVSKLITALTPLLNKDSDPGMLRELITAQMELQKQEILSRIPQPGQPSQPKSFIEQLTEFSAALPAIRSIFGFPESPGGNPGTGTPVQLTGPDGQPMTMDLGQVIDWKRFQGEEKRADERQAEITKTGKVLRENVPDAIQAIIAVAEEAKRGTGAKTPPASQAAEQRQMYKCANPDCGYEFPMPAGEWQVVACPQCGKEYPREEVMGA